MRYGVAQERDWNALADDEFRAVVRAEFEQYPEGQRFPSRRLYWDEQKEWWLRIAAKGWLAPGWPLEFGGMGLTPAKLLVYVEEQERAGISRYQDHGVTQVGPTVIRYGTDEQRRRWIPGILSLGTRWVQGYSEPEAGSDLASLRTRAVREGDVYVVNGQKIWTTMANDSTHIYLLARTDPDVKKQAGISFFLLSLAAPGVTVREIRDIAGHTELCEVFLEDVRIPAGDRIGAENEGWTIGKSLIGFERINVGSPKLPESGLQTLAEVARAVGLIDDPAFRERYVELHLDVVNLKDAYRHYASVVGRGEPLGQDVSLLKLWATETFQRIADLTIETAGAAGGLGGSVEIGDARIDVLGPYYKALPAVIYAGSNEIQRNILSRQILDLPM